ncbi:MAG: hypothetical protein KJN76_10540, partial [Eudoraea sp.]|nr:hypothetical protein [Eudoraea sp.]
VTSLLEIQIRIYFLKGVFISLVMNKLNTTMLRNSLLLLQSIPEKYMSCCPGDNCNKKIRK